MTTLTLQASTIRDFDRRRRIALAIPAVILAYLVHVAFTFDLAGLAQRTRWTMRASSWRTRSATRRM
ncbi:MAG: hypothetical protein FJX25_14820 [Alphaproteobacteria bacterium]|nr:hypothetical protein [Alphaproteobacteria bacterium]